jgi:hypothetical protein
MRKNVGVATALVFGLIGSGCGSQSGAPGEGVTGAEDGSLSMDSPSGGSSGAAEDGSPSDSASTASSSSGSGSGSGSGSSSGSGSGSGSGGGDGGQTAYDYSVYQHHKNGTRNGVYVEPTFTKSAVATMHATGFMGTVSALVYAQPLYVENGPGGVPAFVVATEENHVTVLNASTGAVIWDKGPSTYGQYVTGGLLCGNIPAPGSTTIGITGTPFIDDSSGEGVIYFDAETTPDANTTIKHLVYAVKLADGTILPNWPVDLNAKVSSFASRGQSQRGALQLVNGILYVSYGGLWGDCDAYHGWVVGIPIANPQSPTAWHTSAAKGGIWGSGALPTDGSSVFATTGNTAGIASTAAWGGGEAVIRFGAGATFSGNAADYYVPSTWRTLDTSDADLGGASAVLFDLPGTAKPRLVAQGGKDKYLYVLNRDNLGGIASGAGGPELVRTQVATGQINGAPAVYTTAMGTYVALHTNGGTGSTCPNGGNGNVIAVKITPGSPMTASVAWCSSKSGLGSPMVTTTDGKSNAVVWAANGSLWGFDGDTGALVAGGTSTAMSTSIQGFNTPIAAHGKLVVGVSGQVYVFTP